jgi:4-hydroxy-tetrahydrodipicolinate reductase
MTNVCFAGVTGWTAPPILAAIGESDDLDLVAGVSRSAAGQTLADATSVNVHGRVYGSVAEALAAVPVDVLVDYTSAAAVKDDVETAVDAGVHVVVGSSGLTADDYAALDERARSRGVGVIAGGNFSVMAAILRRAAAMAAEHLDHWEVIDFAGDTKADVPSGTSRELAETLAQVRQPAPGLPAGEVHGPFEARGVEVAGTRIHSLRLPTFVVTTEIVFAGAGERLIMRHDPGPDPEPYVAGTLLAIRRVTDAAGVRRGLDSLLYDGPGPCARGNAQNIPPRRGHGDRVRGRQRTGSAVGFLRRWSAHPGWVMSSVHGRGQIGRGADGPVFHVSRPVRAPKVDGGRSRPCAEQLTVSPARRDQHSGQASPWTLEQRPCSPTGRRPTSDA